MSKLPTHLYKYQNFSTISLENLKNQQIFFSPPINFNDPFDCALNPFTEALSEEDYSTFEPYLCSDEGPQGVKQLFENGRLKPECREEVYKILYSVFDNWVEVNRNKRGVACFSAKKNDVLMWSYYADGHKGFCLEFDTTFEPFLKARKVSYELEIPKIKPTKILQYSDEESFWSMITTKHKNWSHEEEWRLMHIEPGKPYGYLSDALTGVYFGSEMPTTHLEILCLILKGQNPNVKFYRCERIKNSFNLEFKMFSYLSFVERDKL